MIKYCVSSNGLRHFNLNEFNLFISIGLIVQVTTHIWVSSLIESKQVLTNNYTILWNNFLGIENVTCERFIWGQHAIVSFCNLEPYRIRVKLSIRKSLSRNQQYFQFIIDSDKVRRRRSKPWPRLKLPMCTYEKQKRLNIKVKLRAEVNCKINGIGCGLNNNNLRPEHIIKISEIMKTANVN